MTGAGAGHPGSSLARPGGVLIALALSFFLAHVFILPHTFADLDAINFALGVRDFDVAKHQPHPPGYPVFIAMAKVSTAAMSAVGIEAPAVRGLSVLSALSGALLIPLLFFLCRPLLGETRGQTLNLEFQNFSCQLRVGTKNSEIQDSRSDPWSGPLWAAVVVACSPLIWFNALRPLSDVTGLAAAVAAQALLVAVILGPPGPRSSRLLISGALVAGIAIGIRSQAFVLTLPLLGLALVQPRTDLPWRARAAAVAAFGLALVAWGVPLLVANGGLAGYLAALGDQAGEDFSGIVMLWTMRTARVAIDAIEHSFLWPWGTILAGWIVIIVALAGAARMAFRRPAALGVLMLAFGPYAAFHLLFHETVTTRYAVPLVVPVVVLMIYALRIHRRVLHFGAAALVIWSLVVGVPPAISYGTTPAPAAQAMRDAGERTHADAVLAMHAVFRRTEEWYGSGEDAVLRQRHGREIPTLVERWRTFPNTGVTFVADPRRSDLAMLDRRSRELVNSYTWRFQEMPLLGGVRPGEAQLFVLKPPGWMLDTGWALTAEIGGQTERAGAGPARKPSIVWVRSREDASTLMIGGRNLEAPDGAAARVSISIAGQALDPFVVGPGFFFETRALPAGALHAADAYLPIAVAAESLDDGNVRVSLEQFDLQSGDAPMVGFATGWQEPEYNAATGRSWRWMSDAATLWVRPGGRDVTLRLSAESPLRYFDEAPTVVISAGGQTLAQFSPAADFTHEVHIPSTLLAAGEGEVLIRSSKSFVPGNGDQRTLALRVYAVEIN